MAILIDPPAWPAHGTLWSHLVSDSGYDELHAFAKRLRIPRRSFDLDHYDVPASLHDRAIALGAVPVAARDVVFTLRGSGLRVRQVERAAQSPIRRRQYLLSEWAALGELLGAEDPGFSATAGRAGEWNRLGLELIARWNEPHRSYHDERHLEDVLLALDHLAVRGETVSPATLLAAWFHDAVYRGTSTDEQESAALAAGSLRDRGLDTGLVRSVSALILATTPAGANGADAPLASGVQLLDADLSIFASSPQRYGEYAASVRLEYAHVPKREFANGRRRILAAYLDRPAIYRTSTAQQLWEHRARANLALEIARLLPEAH